MSDLYDRQTPTKSRPSLISPGDPLGRRIVPLVDTANANRIIEHIERTLGPVAGSFHEQMGSHVDVSVHVVRPTQEFPVHVLVTSGMSHRPMNVPGGQEAAAYFELVATLPPDFPMPHPQDPQAEFDLLSEAIYWPMRWLRSMARFPHEFDTWLGMGHTVEAGAASPPPAGFTAALVLPPLSLPQPFWNMARPDGATTHFMALWPLHADELQRKIADGLDPLIRAFHEQGVGDVSIPDRPSVFADPGDDGLDAMVIRPAR